MAKVYVFLADGFEDIEALIPIDVLRRGGVDVITVSTTEDIIVESAHEHLTSSSSVPQLR